MMTCTRFAILLCIALAARTGAAGQAGPAAAPSSSDASVAVPDVTLVNVDLSDTPFNSVQVCWPINTLIQPGSNYSLELQAQSAVLQALSWDVVNASLQLSTNGSFRSNYPIVAIVTMPADALAAIANPSSLAETTVDAGFSASNFSVFAPFSSGDINILGLTADTLYIQTSGLGQIIANGTFVNSSIIASGVGSIYVIGMENSAAVNLAGTATVTIGAEAGTNNVTITGQATGVNTVNYNMGTCSVSTPFLLSNPCQQYDAVSTPTIDPAWTCGLRSSGNFTCPAGGLGISQAVASANVFPLAAALTLPAAAVSSPSPVPKVVPRPVVQVPSPSPSPVAIASPLPSPIITPLPLVSPSVSPSPNTVIRSGQGPQFASAAGPGSQTAVSNSGPGAQQTSIGQNSFPSPNNIFGTGTGDFGNLNSNFGNTDSFGKRKLQQIQLGGISAKMTSSSQITNGKVGTQSLPCADTGSSLQIFG